MLGLDGRLPILNSSEATLVGLFSSLSEKEITMLKRSTRQRGPTSETPGRRVVSGAYADVHDLGSHVAKVAADHRLARRSRPAPVDLVEFQRFAAECLEYQRLLSTLGVPVPTLGQTITGPLLDPSADPPVSVITVTEYAGGPLALVTEFSPTRAAVRTDARDVLRAVLPVLQQPRDAAGRVPVGIDVQLKNFVRSASGVVYVDFTPPRFVTPLVGHRVEWPQPQDPSVLREGWKRFYQPPGILLQWLSYCCRAQPAARPLFIRLLREEVPAALTQEVLTAFPLLRLSRRRTREAWERAIASAPDVTDLRAIACALAAPMGDRPQTQTRLRRFWDMSTFSPFPRSAGALDALRAILKTWLPTA